MSKGNLSAHSLQQIPRPRFVSDPSSLASPFTLRRRSDRTLASLISTFLPHVKMKRASATSFSTTHAVSTILFWPRDHQRGFGIANPLRIRRQRRHATPGHFIGRTGTNMSQFSLAGRTIPSISGSSKPSAFRHSHWIRANHGEIRRRFKSHRYDSNLRKSRRLNSRSLTAHSMLTGHATEAIRIRTDYNASVSRLQRVITDDWRLSESSR